jgi:hypothetical protein
LGGHLKWVSEFAGPNSSVPVLLANGKIAQMNRQLRQSLTIDTDGDGIPNGADVDPLDPALVASITAEAAPVRATELAWVASPGIEYTVEATSDPVSEVWTPVTNYISTASSNVTVRVKLPLPSNQSARFYRVSYTP